MSGSVLVLFGLSTLDHHQLKLLPPIVFSNNATEELSKTDVRCQQYELIVSVCRSQLLYFSAAPDAYDGFLRALGVVMATHIPRIPLKKKPTSPTPGSAIFQ